MNIKVNVGNVLEDVKTYSDCTHDTILSDPPYNLSSKWIICPETGKYLMKKSGDFMNKWEGLDHNDLELMFKEFFRVLKHGGFCILFGLQRQSQPFFYYAQKAGFETLESCYWMSLSDFPKATDVSLMIDKRLGNQREIIGIKKGAHDIKGNALLESRTPELKKQTQLIDIEKTKSTSEIGMEFEGYKYSQAPLKKMFELIMVFRKPPKNSVIDDILSNDPTVTPSCLNIDAGRVPVKSSKEDFVNVQGKRKDSNVMNENTCGLNKEGLVIESHPLGRFPPNVLINREAANYIDDMTGDVKGNKQGPCNNGSGDTEWSGSFQTNRGERGYDDSGGASKLMHVCEDGEVFYEPKVGKSERDAGCDAFQEKPLACLQGNMDGKLNTNSGPSLSHNSHPTVKPISLIYRLGKLLKLPERFKQSVYVPFCGTFSEIIGLMKAGIPNIVGCELNPEYVEIGKARLEHWKTAKIKEEIKKEAAEKKPLGRKIW